MSTQWPEFVWVLEAEDICKGQLNGPNGTHCLLGWCEETFGDEFPEADRKAVCVLYQLISDSISIFCSTNPPWKSAKVWNQAMANLGYTEGNPERISQ